MWKVYHQWGDWKEKGAESPEVTPRTGSPLEQSFTTALCHEEPRHQVENGLNDLEKTENSYEDGVDALGEDLDVSDTGPIVLIDQRLRSLFL